MRTWLKIAGLIVLFLGAQLFVSILSTVVCSFLHTSPFSLSKMAWVLFLSNVLVAVILFATKILSFRNTFRKYSCGFKEAVCLFVMMLLAIIPVNGMTEMLQLEDVMKTSFAGLMQQPLGILSIALIGPLVEELIFRKGMIDILLHAQYQPVWAVVISSLAFGIIHGNPAQIPGAFLIGLFFGWIYLHTRSIWPVWALHAVNNAVGVLCFYIWGEDQLLVDLFGHMGLIVAMLVSSGAFVVLALWLRRNFQTKESAA